MVLVICLTGQVLYFGRFNGACSTVSSGVKNRMLKSDTSGHGSFKNKFKARLNETFCHIRDNYSRVCYFSDVSVLNKLFHNPRAYTNALITRPQCLDEPNFNFR